VSFLTETRNGAQQGTAWKEPPMSLTLDLPLYRTDLTACTRCTNPVILQHSWPTAGGGRICTECVAEAVEAHRLATVADRDIPF
jgi:hypothetical protein